MAREIKFRAWDTQYNQWAYFTLGHLISGDVNDIAQRCKNWSLFTGLTDKHGKDIYESDLVRVITDKDNGFKDTHLDDIFEVKWTDGAWWLDYEELFYAIDSQDNTVEVVGNIYETPDLLDNQKADQK